MKTDLCVAFGNDDQFQKYDVRIVIKIYWMEKVKAGSL